MARCGVGGASQGPPGMGLPAAQPLVSPAQICFLMTVTVIGQRMNFMVILHGGWLVVILTRRRRTAIARLWPKYCLFLALFLLYQYLLCVGIPPALCIGKAQAPGPGEQGMLGSPGPKSLPGQETPSFPPPQSLHRQGHPFPPRHTSPQAEISLHPQISAG